MDIAGTLGVDVRRPRLLPGRDPMEFETCDQCRGQSDQIQASVTDTGGVAPSTNCPTRVVRGPYCPLSSMTQDSSHTVLYRGEDNSSEH